MVLKEEKGSVTPLNTDVCGVMTDVCVQLWRVDMSLCGWAANLYHDWVLYVKLTLNSCGATCIAGRIGAEW